MLKEIQTARLNEGRAFQREGPMVAKYLVWAVGGPNSENKKQPASPKSGVVVVKLGSEVIP